MKKTNPKKSLTLYAIQLPILILLGALLVGGYLSIDKLKETLGEEMSVLGKKSAAKGNSNKVSPGQAKKADTTGKPGKGGSTNAALHRKNISEVVENLEAIAEEEEELGNLEVSDEIGDIADEEDESGEEAAEAIEEVEGRGKWKSVLLGSDYKNLGKLRSSLVHNRNRIKKLTKSMNKVEGEDNQLMLQEQLQIMNEEKERIQTFIQEEEGQFSLLGWVAKLFSGYDDTPIDDVEDPVDTDGSSPEIDGTSPDVVEPEPVSGTADL
ncbi:hypothetical protein ACFLZK_00360 [Patescibacteria group bacterium]